VTYPAVTLVGCDVTNKRLVAYEGVLAESRSLLAEGCLLEG